jgi:hypothetical protein
MGTSHVFNQSRVVTNENEGLFMCQCGTVFYSAEKVEGGWLINIRRNLVGPDKVFMPHRQQ